MTNIFAGTLAVIGMFFVVKKNRACFPIFLVVNCLWIYHALNTDPVTWGLLIECPAAMALNVWGFIEWRGRKN